MFRSANDRDSNEVLLLRTCMHDAKDSTGIMRHMLKVTKYFIPRVIGGEFSVMDILDNPNYEIEDYFSSTFQIPPYPTSPIDLGTWNEAYNCWFRATLRESSKTEYGAILRSKGEVQELLRSKDRDEISRRWQDVLDGFEYSEDTRDVMTLIEGIPA